MTVDLHVVLLWALAVSMSGFLSAIICGVTIKRKFSIPVTVLGYILTALVGFALTFIAYSMNITNDFVGIIVFSVIVWTAALILGQDNMYAKLFIAIMATLIANVSTFFLCGTTISFIDKAENPYNVITIFKFILVKFVVFGGLFSLYQFKLKNHIMTAVETIGEKIRGYLPISLISFFGFYVINLITNQLQIMPAIPAVRFYFIGIYGIICLIFVFEYYQIFSSVFWSSRALKTEAELDVASKIQKDMLPCIFPAFPERKEFDIYATMDPAKEVGGDFYDFFLIDQNRLAVVIADVSGKGVPAALFMVIAKTLIKNHAQAGLSPAEVFTSVNNQLCENNEEGLFVTAWMGILEIDSGKFTFVNAGHNPPLIKRADGSFEFLKMRPGFVLAGMENIRYRQKETELKKGDYLYLYTDGVTEATNAGNELYGDDRLQSILNSSAKCSPQELLPIVRADIDLFVKDAPQFDDITMLALKIN